MFTSSYFEVHLLVLHNASWLLHSETKKQHNNCRRVVSADIHYFRVFIVLCHAKIFRKGILIVKKGSSFKKYQRALTRWSEMSYNFCHYTKCFNRLYIDIGYAFSAHFDVHSDPQ